MADRDWQEWLKEIREATARGRALRLPAQEKKAKEEGFDDAWDTFLFAFWRAHSNYTRARDLNRDDWRELLIESLADAHQKLDICILSLAEEEQEDQRNSTRAQLQRTKESE